jgi:S-adenosylmethionine synthetase
MHFYHRKQYTFNYQQSNKTLFVLVYLQIMPIRSIKKTDIKKGVLNKMVKHVIVEVPATRQTRAYISGEGNLDSQNNTSGQRGGKRSRTFTNGQPWWRKNGRPIH